MQFGHTFFPVEETIWDLQRQLVAKLVQWLLIAKTKFCFKLNGLFIQASEIQ